MVEKVYNWIKGAPLEEHTKRKHKIIREYFARYLAVRCAFPAQTKFRLAVVEGFAGGGRYNCGTSGSPLIFIEELRTAVEQFNIRRSAEGMAPLDIECFLFFNDLNSATIAFLQSHVEPLLAAIKSEVPRLHIQVSYFTHPFEGVYPEIKRLLIQGRYQNVLFNLDQCGNSHVERSTIADIASSFNSAEVFYTFAISSLLAFLEKTDPKILLGFLGVATADLAVLEGRMSNDEFLGAAERLVHEAFKSCATYVSPFSIHNPSGWRYWLLHFANNVRARQEYNNILHKNSSMQAHFGRSGLHMLTYDPRHEGALYLFDLDGRDSARKQLMEDIPRLVSEFGDVVGVGQFYSSIYNQTPAHMDDVHSAMIENPDLEVITDKGGERRKGGTIEGTDTLRMKKQRSFFPLFLGDKTEK
jgi:three-Cys-motif partner protein